MSPLREIPVRHTALTVYFRQVWLPDDGSPPDPFFVRREGRWPTDWTLYTATIPTVSFANIGVILTVKPNITPDVRIYLEIVPEVSELKELVNVQQIATTTGTLNQQAPRITLTNANTVVSVNDGQTVVLGGLIHEYKTAA